MKDIKKFISEAKKEYNCNYNEDDLKCILASLAFVKISFNKNAICKELNIDEKVFDELYDDVFEIVDDPNKILDVTKKLYDKMK